MKKETDDRERTTWAVISTVLIKYIDENLIDSTQASVRLGTKSFSALPTARSRLWQLGARLMKRAIILTRAWAPDYVPQGTPGTN
jgi:hypothetical protein